MGHDTHFLDRLSRVERGHTELALELYRDPELVAALLQTLAPPEGADRIALALDSQPEGPHLILARDGHFVTCLGAGMSVGPWPVISRAKLDAAIGRFERLRTATETLTELSQRGFKSLIETLSQHPEVVERKVIEPLIAVVPLLFDALADSVSPLLARSRTLLLKVEVERLRGAERTDALRVSLRSLLMAAHYLVLTASHGAALLARHQQKFIDAWPSLVLYDLAELPLPLTVAVRTTWAMSSFGKLVLPTLKTARTSSCQPYRCLLAASSMGCMAVARPAMRAEIEKALDAQITVFDAYPQGRELAAPLERASRDVLRVLREPEVSLDHSIRTLAAELSVEGADPAKRDAQCGMVMAQLLPDLFSGGGRMVGALINMLPWLGKASATDLYLPPIVEESWRKVLSEQELEDFFEARKRVPRARREPLRSDPKPGRNDPCTCGSGKKAKRCCAA